MKKLILLLVLCSFNFKAGIPKLNAKIIEYLDTVMGKRVDRGECWDLALGALTYSGSYFDRSSQQSTLIYGRRVNPKQDEIFPGDLIQFEKVELKWQDGNAIYSETMEHHTAIVYKVNGLGDYELAHQNTQKWGKKVGVSNFRLDRVTKGQIMFYRPIRDKE